MINPLTWPRPAAAVTSITKSSSFGSVVGERTGIGLLGRPRHTETRVSGVVLEDRVDEDAAPISEHDVHNDLVPAPAAVYRARGPDEPSTFAILYSHWGSLASPAGWLALDPGIAAEVGLTADPGGPFGWLLDGNPAATSVWWRSGYRFWQPYSDRDEVGEGWLVVATPDVAERLAALGDARRRWNVVTE